MSDYADMCDEPCSVKHHHIWADVWHCCINGWDGREWQGWQGVHSVDRGNVPKAAHGQRGRWGALSRLFHEQASLTPENHPPQDNGGDLTMPGYIMMLCSEAGGSGEDYFGGGG